MSPRAHDLDFNPGGFGLVIDGDTLVTKFGHDYNPATELFATLIRIRNSECEGFGACDYLNSPHDTASIVSFKRAGGSTLDPDIGHIHVRDRSILAYFTGTIRSGTLEASEEAAINVWYKNGTTPTIDGVAADGTQALVPDQAYSLVFEDSVTDETRTMTVVVHDLAQFTLAEVAP